MNFQDIGSIRQRFSGHYCEEKIVGELGEADAAYESLGFRLLKYGDAEFLLKNGWLESISLQSSDGCCYSDSIFREELDLGVDCLDSLIECAELQDMDWVVQQEGAFENCVRIVFDKWLVVYYEPPFVGVGKVEVILGAGGL